MRRTTVLLSASLIALTATAASAQNAAPRNLILFVPDGLRGRIVTPQTAPAMAEVRDKGVHFRNSHSLFPTFTMANGSAMATGHYLGDTGVFSNTIFTGYTSVPAGDTVVPFIENDAVLGDIDEHFSGDYLNEETLLKMARAQGFSTAAIGKLGPTLQFDHADRGKTTIVIDDSTGGKNGVPLPDEMKDALTKANLPVATPPRGDNGKAGDARTPGTTSANVAQQAYMADVAARVVLPMFKARNKPFVLVFWSRDPDGSQHNTGDSLNTTTPGINGPTSMAGIKNADNNLAQLRKALDELGLSASTNIMISSDHGFSTISKESKTSPAAKISYADTPKDFLPMGFLAIDLAKALKLPLFDPNDKNAPVAADAGNERKLADRTIKALLEQDYVSGIFVNDELGRFPGTLPMSQLDLVGKAVTPHPSIVVNFRSWSSGCEEPTNCSVHVADTVLRQGQGMHGSFSRGDTLNFTAAIGPDFKSGYVDALPVSNADVGATAAKVMGLTQKLNGRLVGRVMTEAMLNGATPQAYAGTVKSKPAANGLRTLLNFQRVGTQRYFDTAGFPGRTLGLEAEENKKTAGK